MNRLNEFSDNEMMVKLAHQQSDTNLLEEQLNLLTSWSAGTPLGVVTNKRDKRAIPTDTKGVYIILGQQCECPTIHTEQGGFVNHSPAYNCWRANISSLGAVYVGKSKDLQYRLSGYFRAVDSDRPPVNQMMGEAVYGDPFLAYRYMTSSIKEQQLLRRKWMRNRNMWIKWAPVRTLKEAKQLEHQVIKLMVNRGVLLWNDITFKNVYPFPIPDELADLRRGQKPSLKGIYTEPWEMQDDEWQNYMEENWN